MRHSHLYLIPFTEGEWKRYVHEAPRVISRLWNALGRGINEILVYLPKPP